MRVGHLGDAARLVLMMARATGAVYLPMTMNLKLISRFKLGLDMTGSLSRLHPDNQAGIDRRSGKASPLPHQRRR